MFKILLVFIRLQKYADILCYRDVEMGGVWGIGALEVGVKLMGQHFEVKRKV